MRNRHLRRALIIAGTVVAALLFFLGGVVLRVLMGPISLGPFAGAIEDSLNHSVSGLVIRFDRAELEWSRDAGKINLVVLGTRVFDLQDHIIAQAPKADIDFDAAAFFMGRLVPTQFSLIGMQLAVARNRDGTLRIGFDAAQENNHLLDAILDTLNSGGSTKLDHFAIRDARLAFRDEASGLFIVAPRASLDIAAQKIGLHAMLRADVEVSGKPAQISADADLNDSGVPRAAIVTLRHFDFSSLAANSPAFSALAPIGLIADMEAKLAVDAAGNLQTVTFDAIGNGALGSSQPGGISVPVEKFHLNGAYDGAQRQLKIADFTIDGEHARAKAVAGVSIIHDAAGWTGLSGTLETRALFFDVPGLFAGPVNFNSMVVSGNFDRVAKTFTLSRAAVTGGPLAIDLSGAFDFSGDGAPGVALKGNVAQLPVRELVKYWPLQLGSGARDWLDPNITAGMIGPIQINTNIAPGALDAEALSEDAVSITFPYSGATALYIHGMTPITEAVGTGAMTGDTFHGTMAAANIGTLGLSEGDVRIPNLHLRAAKGEIHAHVEGGMPELMALINEEPLGYPKRFGMDPTKVGGRAKVDVDFVIPMLKDINVDQIAIGVKVATTDLSLPLDEKRKLENGNANFTVSGTGLTSEGTASISDVPVTFQWTEEFGGAREAMTTHVTLSGAMDEAARRKLGLGLDFLTGPVRTQLALEGRRVKFETGKLQADLTPADIKLRPINWEKPPGTAAALSASVRFGAGGAVSLSDLVITGNRIDVRGAIDINAAGDLTRAGFDKVVLGANDDFTAKWQVAPDGTQSLQVQGRSLDASKLFVSAPKTQTPAPAQADTDFTHPLRVDAKLDRLSLRDNQSLRNFLLNAEFGANERVDRFALAADGPLKGKVAGGLSVAGDQRRLTLTADDGGAFLDGLSGFSSIRGGALVLSADFNASPRDAQAGARAPVDYKGNFQLRNFTLMNQPFLARFFAIGSLDGPLRLLQGQGIAFDQLNAPFSARAKQITIDEGRASGPAIGFTFEGLVDRKTDHVDVSGSLVPVFGLNSMLGNVPIVGDLLVSKQGEGIFGLTYSVKGDVDEPVLMVNPLSALTPGIFRRIFEFSGPSDQAAPISPSAPAQRQTGATAAPKQPVQ